MFYLQLFAHLWHYLFEEGHVLDINRLRLEFEGEDSNVGPNTIELGLCDPEMDDIRYIFENFNSSLLI